MVKVFEELFPAETQGHGNRKDGMYIDQNLMSNLDVLKEAVKQDWDGLIVVDGAEGSGKSVLAQQAAFYCDPSLTLDRIVFKPKQFRKAVLEAKQYQAVVFDEAFGGLSSRKTMSETNFAIVSMLTEIRQKNLFLFIVLPTFFDLDKYVALWRSRALIHVYADKMKRGFFQFYSYQKKKDLYVNGKKFYNYRCVNQDFSGRFVNLYPVGKDEYKKKKADSLHEDEAIDKPKERITSVERRAKQEIIKNVYLNRKKYNLRVKDIPELTGISQISMNRYIANDNQYQ